MSSNAKKVKKKLQSIILDMAKNSRQFTKSPEKDFSRKRKLDFPAVLSVLLSMSGGSVANGLLEFFKYHPNTASTSAFVQQRAKIKPEALEHLFHTFSKEAPAEKLYSGYRLLAVDGSDLQIFTNCNDADTYYPGVNGQHPYSLLHLNALYDLENRVYVDALVQKSRKQNEHRALNTMVDRSDIPAAILLADRGYESYNNMAHLQEKGWKFLIRIKDAKMGIAAGLNLPDEQEFDLNIDLLLTHRQTKEVKALCIANRNKYKWIPSNVSFDYLPATSHAADPLTFFNLRFRIVRFTLSNSTYETVVTNLDADDFEPTNLKDLYIRRWGIETSFRHLKYTVGLVHLHSKKMEFIFQEIFARLTMYNFSELITSHVVIRKANSKFLYSVNFSVAVHVCRNLFLGNVSPPNVEALLSRFISPVRPGRSNSRKAANTSPFSFLYRVA